MKLNSAHSSAFHHNTPETCSLGGVVIGSILHTLSVCDPKFNKIWWRILQNVHRLCYKAGIKKNREANEKRL